MSTTSRQACKFFQTNWSTFCFLPLMTHEWGQNPWLVSSFYPTLKFIQHLSSTMCDVSTSKIKQTRQQHLHYKELVFFSQSSIASKTVLTFVPHKSHIWLNSKFCFLLIHGELVLSTQQYTQSFSHLKILSLYVNAFIFNLKVTENWR